MTKKELNKRKTQLNRTLKQFINTDYKTPCSVVITRRMDGRNHLSAAIQISRDEAVLFIKDRIADIEFQLRARNPINMERSNETK